MFKNKSETHKQTEAMHTQRWHCVCVCLIYEWFGLIQAPWLIALWFDIFLLCDAHSCTVHSIDHRYLSFVSPSLSLTGCKSIFFFIVTLEITAISKCIMSLSTIGNMRLNIGAQIEKKSASNVFPLRFLTKLKKHSISNGNSNSNRISMSWFFHHG